MGHAAVAVPVLLEREPEVAVLAEAVHSASTGAGRCVVAVGPAGMGKTRLLAEAASLAVPAGLRVVRARGSELERDFGFGLVRQLFEPVLAAADENCRRRWLSGSAAPAAAAVGPVARAETPVGDFAVLHSLYWLTVNVCQEQPLALVWDDLHWADEPSLRLLAYLLPRLEGLRLVMVASWRGDHGNRLLEMIASDTAVTRLRLAPLTAPAGTALVGQVLREQPEAEFAAACHRAAGGNPLLLTELAEAMRAQAVAPVAANAERVAGWAGDAVGRRVRLWLNQLPDECARLATAAAVLGQDAPLTHAAALAQVDSEQALAATDRLRQAQILTLQPPDAQGKLRFVHPLVRVAVYDGLSLADQVNRHRHAARLLSAAGADAEQIAAHLLRLPAPGDPNTTQILQNAAAAAVARSALSNAYAYLQRCLAEPMPPEQRLPVLEQAGALALTVDVAAAVAHRREAFTLAADPLTKARIGADLGFALIYTGQLDESEVVFRGCMSLLPDDEQDIRRLCQGGIVAPATAAPPTPQVAEAVQAYRRLPPPTTFAGTGLDATLALHEAYAGFPEAVTRARRAFDSSLLTESHFGKTAVGHSASWHTLLAADVDDGIDLLNAAVAAAYRGGSSIAACEALGFRGLGWLWRGALVEAEQDTRQAVTLVDATQLRFGRPYAGALLCQLLVEQGHLDEAARALDWIAGPQLLAQATQLPVAFLVLEAQANLLRAQDQPEQALQAALAAGRSFAAVGGHNPAIVGWRSHAALSLLALGRHTEAERYATEELDLARAWGAPRALGRALRTLGLVRHHQPDALDLLRQAVTVLTDSPAQLERAHALYALGAALRRHGHRQAARTPLAQAVALAQRCAAAPLATQATTELRAAGGRTRRHTPTGIDALTPSERRVAELTAAGHSNKQVAQTLFVTPKTVEVHLSNVYRKLDVTNRHQMAHFLRAALARP